MLKSITQNLHRVFLWSLIAAQVIAFGSVWATVNADLSVQFINPVANQQIASGTEILIQAQIANSAYQLNTVHFVLSSEVNGFNDVSFQALRGSGNIWTADSAWLTADYPAGDYHLSVRALSYDDNGSLIDFNQPAGINITLMSVPEEQDQVPNNPEPVLPTVSILQPVANAVISGAEYQARVSIENLGDYQLRAVFRRSGGDLINSRPASSIDGNIHTFVFNTTEISDGQAQLAFFVEANGNQQFLATVYVAIDNVPEPLPNPTVVNVVSPNADNLTISDEDFLLAVRLSRELTSSETAGATLYREQGSVLTVNLALVNNNTYRGYFNSLELPDGRYQVVFWFNNGQRIVLHNSLYLNIDNPEADEPPAEDNNEQRINLIAPNGPITTESFILRLETRFTASNLHWQIRQQNDEAISINGSMVRVDDGRQWSREITLPRSIFINGNYLLTVQITNNDGSTQAAEFILALDRVISSPPSQPEQGPINPPQEDAEEEQSANPAVPPSDDQETEEELPNQEQESSGQSESNILPPAQQAPIATLDPRCQQRNITDQNRCLQWLAIFSEDIDRQCIEQEIYDPLACEDYLNRISVDRECQEKNIFDRRACQDYLMEKYSPEVNCRLSDNELCRQILRETYLNRLVVKQQRRDKVDNIVKPLVGKAVDAQELAEQFKRQELIATLPIKTDNKAKFLLINSQAATVLLTTDRLEAVNSAVLAKDTDGDGLPDDLEKYYGTDLDNFDSDNDGYSDGEEVSTNHNPLGAGVLDKARTDFDQVILSGLPLEQPKIVTDRTDPSLNITEPTMQDDSSLLLTGQANPDAWVTVYIYSDLPLVMVAKADASGNWSYAIGDALADGEHKIYVTVNDNTGKIVKQSEPLSFLIRGAQAVTVDEYFSPDKAGDKVNNLILYYLLGAGFLIFIALAMLIYLHRDKESVENNEIRQQ